MEQAKCLEVHSVVDIIVYNTCFDRMSEIKLGYRSNRIIDNVKFTNFRVEDNRCPTSLNLLLKGVD